MNFPKIMVILLLAWGSVVQSETVTYFLEDPRDIAKFSKKYLDPIKDKIPLDIYQQANGFFLFVGDAARKQASKGSPVNYYEAIAEGIEKIYLTSDSIDLDLLKRNAFVVFVDCMLPLLIDNPDKVGAEKLFSIFKKLKELRSISDSFREKKSILLGTLQENLLSQKNPKVFRNTMEMVLLDRSLARSLDINFIIRSSLFSLENFPAFSEASLSTIFSFFSLAQATGYFNEELSSLTLNNLMSKIIEAYLNHPRPDLKTGLSLIDLCMPAKRGGEQESVNSLFYSSDGKRAKINSTHINEIVKAVSIKAIIFPKEYSAELGGSILYRDLYIKSLKNEDRAEIRNKANIYRCMYGIN